MVKAVRYFLLGRPRSFYLAEQTQMPQFGRTNPIQIWGVPEAFNLCRLVAERLGTRLAGRAIRSWIIDRLFHAGAAVQIGLDLQPRSAAESCPIDLQILHDPLHVVAGFGERYQLDPVDRVDLGIARIAVTLDQFFSADEAGVVGRERHNVGAAIVLDQAAELRGAQRRVVDRIGLQPAEVEAGAVFLADIEAGIRRDLPPPVRLGPAG